MSEKSEVEMRTPSSGCSRKRLRARFASRKPATSERAHRNADISESTITSTSSHSDPLTLFEPTDRGEDDPSADALVQYDMNGMSSIRSALHVLFTLATHTCTLVHTIRGVGQAVNKDTTL